MTEAPADDALPSPLIDPEVDCRGLDFMPLEVRRLRDSDLVAISTGDEFKAAVLLWARAWEEVPAGSIPNDERILSRAAGLSQKQFSKVREVALRGWVLCSDGRLYHPLIADLSEKAWKMRRNQSQRASSRWAAENAKKATKSKAAKSPRTKSGDAVAYAGSMQGTGTGRGTVTDSTSQAQAIDRTIPKHLGEKPIDKRGYAIIRGFISQHTSGGDPGAFLTKLIREHGLSNEELNQLGNDLWARGDPANASGFLKSRAVEIAGQRNRPSFDPQADSARSEAEDVSWQIHEGYLIEYRKTNIWPPYQGAMPETPGCKIERELLVKYGFRKELN